MPSKKYSEPWEWALNELHKRQPLSWIANELQISRRTIQRWKNGKGSPDSVNYGKIMKLHGRVCK